MPPMKPHIHLREIRERQRLSQVELARRAGVHQTYISMLELGQREPSLSTVAQLAAALEVDPLELLSFGTPVHA
jgi:transcriptional regulator with XRE-family HTH domain